jgi:hypothetical protein
MYDDNLVNFNVFYDIIKKIIIRKRYDNDVFFRHKDINFFIPNKFL